MRRFSAILLALDGSPHARIALDLACILAAGGGRIDALHVCAPRPHLHGRHIDWRSDDAEENREAVAVAREAAERASEHGVTIDVAIVAGDPVDELLAAAERCAADAIVMGSHGRTGLERALMGSVAEGVLHRARVPVVVVHQPVSR